MQQTPGQPASNGNQAEEVVAPYDYQYTGSQQQQIGGDVPGPSWTAHDDPRQPGYIDLCSGPLTGPIPQ